MSREIVGQYEARDINARIDRLLNDLGEPEPPLRLELVRELLRLDLKYYSASDPSYFQEISHKVRVGAKQILARPGLIFDVIKKAELAALFLPDTKRILIDSEIPSAKHRWIEAHEISHSIIDWHSDFMFGDNKLTLNPQCDETIEAEANYGGGRLLFLGSRFAEESRSIDLDFKNIRNLSKQYGNSIQSTLWRTVEEREPEAPIFGLVSIHPHHPTIGKKEYGGAPRFIRSDRFRKQFDNISPDNIFSILTKHARYNKGGPVVETQEILLDSSGEKYVFRIESFSNTHALLTYGVCCGKKSTLTAVA